MKSPRSGWLLYATFLRHVADGPVTAQAMHDKTGVNMTNTRIILRRMHSAGLVHVAAYARVGPKRMNVHVYAIGCGVDAEVPLNLRTGLPLRHTLVTGKTLPLRAEMTAFVSIINELRNDACTVRVLAERCGINHSFAYVLMRHLVALRLVRIDDWEGRLYGGAPAAMYEFAVDGKNTPRPARIPRDVIDAKRNAGLRERNRILNITRALSANGMAFPLAARRTDALGATV